MRILNLIPLALMVSFIFAGCAELPHQPALVIDGPDTAKLTTETVVDDDLIIPGLELDPAPKEGTCYIVVKLMGVYYGGDDIGDEWIIKGTVNNQLCTPGRVKLKHGQWNPLNITCIEGHSKYCYPHLFFFHLCAQEQDFIFPDKGCGSGMAGIFCLPQTTGRKIIVPVSVTEVPYLFGFPSKVARLYFVYAIKTACVVT